MGMLFPHNLHRRSLNLDLSLNPSTYIICSASILGFWARKFQDALGNLLPPSLFYSNWLYSRFFNTDDLPRHNRLIRCPGWPVIGQTFKKWYENHPKVGYCFSKNQEPLLGDHQVRPSWPCTTQKSQIHYGQSFYCDFQLNLLYRGIEVAIQVCIIWYSRIGLLQ